MSISAISSSDTSTNIQSWQAMARQRQQDFQSLANSLTSGDLGGAQQAYSDIQTTASSNASSSTASSSASSPVKQDFSTLGQDLLSGNVSQAQKDFTQMKNDLQAVFNQNGGSPSIHHHHGHHSPLSDSSTPQSSTAAVTSTDPSADTSISNAMSSLFSQYAPANASGSGSMVSSLLNLVA